MRSHAGKRQRVFKPLFRYQMDAVGLFVKKPRGVAPVTHSSKGGDRRPVLRRICPGAAVDQRKLRRYGGSAVFRRSIACKLAVLQNGRAGNLPPACRQANDGQVRPKARFLRFGAGRLGSGGDPVLVNPHRPRFCFQALQRQA